MTDMTLSVVLGFVCSVAFYAAVICVLDVFVER